MAPFAAATASEAVESAVIAITAAGSPTARLDAEVLLAWAMGTTRTALYLDPDAEVSGPAVRRFQDAVRRRSAGREPVAYIVGTKGFRRIELAVDGNVLVPRPETEHLVEAVLALASPDAVVVDVGTGSGAIALALKEERPDLRVVATDVSAPALDVARANAATLGLDVTFLAGDLLEAIGEGDPAPDVVVANLPYVPDGDRAGLPAEIRHHEPAVALFGGPDGLDVVRRLVTQAGERGVGAVALEVGQGQPPATADLLRDAGYTHVGIHPDLAGIDRVVVGRRP
jgi:release factor glutamine methyltransferase